MNKNTRGASSSKLGSVSYVDLESLSVDPITGLPVRQAPTGVAVLGRISQLTKEHDCNGRRISRADAYITVAEELSEFWIFALNIYPVTRPAIVTMLRDSYEGRKGTKNKEAVAGLVSLLKYPVEKRKANWEQMMEKFNNKNITGFDIRSFDVRRVKDLENKHEVKMKEEDVKLYQDNCKLKVCKCDWKAPLKCAACPRQMYTSDEVDLEWRQWAERRKADRNTVDSLKEKDLKDKEKMKVVNTDQALGEIDPESSSHMEIDDKSDETFTLPTVSGLSLQSKMSGIGLRSSSSSALSSSDSVAFPKIPLRFGRRSLNPKVMRAMVHCQATYKVSDNDIEGLFVDVANMVFDQDWKKGDTKDFNENEFDEDEEVYELQEESVSQKRHTIVDEEGNNVETPPRKRRRVQADLTNHFPTRATRRRYLKHGALLNLRHVGQKILKKSQDQVITWGFDDTTKAAGCHLFDVKSSNITLDGEDMDRETYTTGFTSNLSHSGQDQATTLRHGLKVLSVLAGGECGEQFDESDMIENIDFWMSDRSADGTVLLDNLGIEENKRLKCNGHVTLTVDEAINSVLLDAESVIGRDKLLGGNIGNNAYKSNSSIITLGLIALAKGLSPSHAALSYSLYMRYKIWRTENDLDTADFKGFQSNRFGRTPELASLFLVHRDDLIRFFDETVDENSNMLVLALSQYINSEWFQLGCKIYNVFDDLITRPLCEILGIDKFGKQERDDRNWVGVKKFFEGKLSDLKSLETQNNPDNNFQRLVSSAAAKVRENLERQLNMMTFYKDDIDSETLSKMKHAPLTNSGCESRMAQLDVRVKFSGGAAPLDTLSDKQIVSVNKYLTSTDFDNEGAGELFKWARTSEEAKLAIGLQQDFLAQVKITKTLAAAAKKAAKEKKVRRAFKLGSECLGHGGPVTAENLQLLNTLSEKEIILEVSYLKATVASELKLRKRIQVPESGKYKMEKLPVEQLKLSIQNVLKPSGSVSSDVEKLLENLFK